MGCSAGERKKKERGWALGGEEGRLGPEGEKPAASLYQKKKQELYYFEFRREGIFDNKIF
jgi:hypothetical protein